MKNIIIQFLFIMICTITYSQDQQLEIEKFKKDYLDSNCWFPDDDLKSWELQLKQTNRVIRLMNRIEGLDKRDFNAFTDFIIKTIPDTYSNWICGSPFSPYNPFNLVCFDLRWDKFYFEFITGDDSRMIAKAHSPLRDDIRFVINIDKWEMLNNYERLWLLLHEFGHEAFGLDHAEGGSLMYPLMPEDLKNTTRNDKMELRQIDALELRIKAIKSPEYLNPVEKNLLKQRLPLARKENTPYELDIGLLAVDSFIPSNRALNVLMEAAFSFILYVDNDREYSNRSVIIDEFTAPVQFFDLFYQKDLKIPFKLNGLSCKSYSF